MAERDAAASSVLLARQAALDIEKVRASDVAARPPPKPDAVTLAEEEKKGKWQQDYAKCDRLMCVSGLSRCEHEVLSIEGYVAIRSRDWADKNYVKTIQIISK